MTSDIELQWDPVEAAAAFGLGSAIADPRPVARGAMGRIWRFETSGGTWAVKQLFEVPRPEHVLTEVRFVRRARDAGLAAPAAIPTIAGDVFAVIAGRSGPVAVRVYEWIDVDRVLRSPVDTVDAARAGEALAVMHNAGEPTDEQPDDWYRRRCVGGSWGSTVAQLRASGEDGLADALTDAMEHVRVLEARISDERTPSVICHRDFQPENVLVASDDRFVIIDWENAGPLDVSAELANSLLSWAADEGCECDDRSIRAFLEGYASRRPVPVPSSTAVFSMDVVTRLNYLNVQAEIVTDPAAEMDDRDRARSVFTEVLRALPGVAVLDGVLDIWREIATER